MRSHPSLFSDRAEVPQWRLDDYVAAKHLPLPDLVKIDTQACEHLVLAGGRRTIAAAQVLMIETWLYREYGPSTPLLTDIIALASSLGFILFKLGDEFRHEDGRLYDLDVVFTKPGVLDAAGSNNPATGSNV
jgi:Methyltransferase FkbM domain